MVQPYNYSLNIKSPGEAFIEGIQIGQVGRANRMQAEQREREADKVRRLNGALAALGPNATYADYMVQVRNNPDLADVLLGQQKTFGDARKNALFGAGEQAFMLLRPDAQGNISSEAAIAKLEESALAFENSGEVDVAKQLRDSAQGIRANPATARNTLGVLMAFADPDRFKKINEGIDRADLTAFQKNLVAAGIDPNSERGRSLAEQFATNQADPLVELETPSGGKFVGPRSEYFRLYGADAPKPNVVPSPKSQAEYEALAPGTQYRAPDGSLKVKGGQTGSKPSGTFQGQ